jgi:hypothetical protein
MENLTIAQKLQIKKLKDLDVTKVEICYSGGGDDGCIDDFTAYKIDEKGEENYNPDIDLNSFEETFVDYIYSLLSTTIEWDWVNNEGGYGTLTLDIEKQEIDISHSQRHIEDYHYSVENNKSLEPLFKEIKDGSPITA